MDNIKDIVQDVLKKISPRKENPQQHLENRWGNFLSKEEKKHTQLVGIKENIIFVTVDTPAWGYQLKTRKEKILAEIKKTNPEIQDIRFNVGMVS